MLFALVSAVTAAILASFATRLSGLFALWNEIEWLAWSGLACLATSLFRLLRCIRPEGINNPHNGDYFAFFAQYAGQPEALRAHLATATPDAECAQLVALSILATRKYQLIARSISCLAAALLLLAAALVLNDAH
ncbi:Pycsar system effector family protein [Streptomyces sp. NPDC057651]|uniref:Pycsar system effector family protein n=1 Tax=Streptomyces sp. NPDC057651 TaxID=3346194 RepID=UPI0036CF72B9